jgi:hypothetical protein
VRAAKSQITKRSQFDPLMTMTSLKQIEANRRNAQKSTGPSTPGGKQRSRYNALRHGLTAETVIGVLERAEDYAAFEAALSLEYGVQSVIACELVARLASALWRLRRATAIETGLFEIQADPLAGFRQSLRPVMSSTTDDSLNQETELASRAIDSAMVGNTTSSTDHLNVKRVQFNRTGAPTLTQCFLRLANQSNFAFDRLSRYEARLWRQADQIMLALCSLHRSSRRDR